MRKKGYWRLEGGTIQTEGNRTEGGRDDASRTSLPTRSSFPCLRWTTSTRIVSNASRFEIDREREKERTTGGKRRRREGRKEKKRRRRGRSTLEALRALLCPWKGVRKRDITRTLFHPPTRFPRFCQPPPSIRLHLAAFGETEPTPRITELSSRASRPRDATHFPLRSCVTLSWRRSLVDNLCDPSRANGRFLSRYFFYTRGIDFASFFFPFSLPRQRQRYSPDMVSVSRSTVYDTDDEWNGTRIENAV